MKIKISETFSQEEQQTIRTNVRRGIQIIEKNTKRRHQRKIERDNLCIENNNNNNKRNRRFSRKPMEKKKRKKKSQTQSERKDKKGQRRGS